MNLKFIGEIKINQTKERDNNLIENGKLLLSFSVYCISAKEIFKERSNKWSTLYIAKKFKIR